MSEPQTGEGMRAARHHALADPSRLALLRLLEGAVSPLDVRSLSEAVGLHPNTVRWHLGVLIDVAAVIEVREPSGARGRPRHGYRLVPGVLDDHPGGFRLLADVLAEVLSRGGGAESIEEIGRERGSQLVADQAAADGSASQAVAAVVRMLEVFGFQPRLRREHGGRRIDMHPCPFGETATRYASVVCPLHLGLIRGALDRLDSGARATSLQPFVKPNLCIAHLVGGAKKSRRVAARTK